MMNETPDRLLKLWEAYRRATPEPEPSVNFMPELWGRIESARPTGWTLSLAWLARRIVPLAAALTLAMGIYVWTPPSGHMSYVDTLAASLLDELANTEENI